MHRALTPAVLRSRMPSALPPLVLLPGTLCDERVFAPLLAALQEEFHGLCANVILSAHHTTMQSAAMDVLAGAPERFALLGFSLGGLLALEMAHLAPERIVGLALLNVNAAPAPMHTHAARHAAVLQAEATGVGEYVRQHLWPSYVAAASQQNAALQDLIADMAQKLGPAAFASQTEAALTRRDYRPLVSALTMPTLVQAGEEDAVCPVAAQQQLAQAFPHATFDVIPDAGHFALLEQQDAVAASVAGWFHNVTQQHRTKQEIQ